VKKLTFKEKIKNFSIKIGGGLKQEYHETKQIPKHIQKGNFKEAAQQVGDIGKMVFIALVWILPAGVIVSSFIVKFSKKIRPSAFQGDLKEFEK